MYNSSNYNEANYNSTHFSVEAFEALSSNDQRSLLADSVRADIQLLTDAVFKLIADHTYVDDVVAADDDIANTLMKVLTSSLIITDTNQIESVTKNLSDLITTSDLYSIFSSANYVDSMTLTDTLTKSIIDKTLHESIRLQSWLSTRKIGSEWSN